MSGESNSEARPEAGDAGALALMDEGRRALHDALVVRGPAFDDVTREVLSAVDAIDRARKRLRESMRRVTP